MIRLPSIDDVDVAGKRVLIRADLNVPMDGATVTDTTRIDRFCPTLRGLLDRGAAVVVMTHLGRPDGQPNPLYSTRPVAEALARTLGQEVAFIGDCVGPAAERGTGGLAPGRVAMLENLRFHKGETDNYRNFAVRLSVLGDIYVNDAFSCSHRAHASTHAIAGLMPAYAGPSLIAEVEALEAAISQPRRPAAALVGGAKISTKIGVLANLAGKVDYLVIVGGMANTFLAAEGIEVGKSLAEPSAFGLVGKVRAAAERTGCRIVLPVDVAVARNFSASETPRIVPVDAIGKDEMALDAGPATIDLIGEILAQCKTLLWNGPLGAFELEPFSRATIAVARHAARLTREGKLVTVAGGGDTVAALNLAGVTDDFTYVSTAGGAFLEWIEGHPLPGIEILKTSHRQTEEA